MLYVLSLYQLLFYELSFNYLRSLIISFLWLLSILIFNIIGDLWYLTQSKHTLGQQPTKYSKVYISKRRQNILVVLPADSIFLRYIADKVFHVIGIINQNIGGVCYIILIVLIMPRLVCLSELRFGKFMSFEVCLSELSLRAWRVYKYKVS